MNIDFSKLSAALNQKNIIEPREIFLSLTNKSTKYNGYLRDVQTEVLELWYQNRNKKDNIIKMNTGSGTTTRADDNHAPPVSNAPKRRPRYGPVIGMSRPHKIRHTRKVNHKFNANDGETWNNRST